MVSLAPPTPQMLATSLLTNPKPSRKHRRTDEDSLTSSAPVKTKRVRFAELGSNTTLLIEDPSVPNTPNGKKKRDSSLSASAITSNLFKKFVENAIDERAQGKSVHYEDLRRKFQADPSEKNPDCPVPTSSELVSTLAALTNVVSRLNNACAKLVEDVIEMTWVGRDDAFVSAYVKFLGNLVSAHANYMGVVTAMLVRNFCFLPTSVGRIPGYPDVEQDVMYDRVHYALQFILELVPTAAGNTLFPALVAEFPHITETKNETIAYMANALRVVEYVPPLRQKLLNVIVDRVIKVDIAIQVDLAELPDKEANRLEESLTCIEVEDSESSEEEDSDDDDEDSDESDNESEAGAETNTTTPSQHMLPTDADPDAPPADLLLTPKTRTLHHSLSKLDHMLSLLFAHYSPLLEPPTPSTTTFTHLHALFQSTILPTHRSRYTQFLIFWAAQKSPSFSDAFCVSMLEKAMDNTRPARTRNSAAAYIASYVARAKAVPTKDIRAVVSILCRWLAQFIELREPECDGPDVGKWSVFYTIAQAVMYIFCFRFRELDDAADAADEEEEEEEVLTPKIRWASYHLPTLSKAIHSRFNPLKVCSQTVVQAFAGIAEKQQFLYCWSVIEQNKRRGKKGDVLDGYFPFDPVRLRRTGEWVGGCYVEWKDPNEDEDVDDDDDDDDEEEDDEEEEEDDEASSGDDTE